MKYEHYFTSSLMRATDLIITAFIFTLLCTACIGAHRIPDWETHAYYLLLAGILFAALSWLSRNMDQNAASFALRVIIILSVSSYLFQAVGPLQHVLFKQWFDDFLISMEASITGTEMSIYLQQFITPSLTEWMMFCYVIYIVLLPLTAYLCYRHAGRTAGEQYLLNLAAVNIICYSGFILLPVKSPLFYMPDVYSVPLDGGIFTWCGEWIRANQHYPGGALPSPHAAAGTIMLFSIFRFARRYVYLYLPIILTIYVATVYGRYHYSWDILAGISTAVLVTRITPSIRTKVVLWESFIRRKSLLSNELINQEGGMS